MNRVFVCIGYFYYSHNKKKIPKKNSRFFLHKIYLFCYTTTPTYTPVVSYGRWWCWWWLKVYNHSHRVCAVKHLLDSFHFIYISVWWSYTRAYVVNDESIQYSKNIHKWFLNKKEEIFFPPKKNHPSSTIAPFIHLFTSRVHYCIFTRWNTTYIMYKDTMKKMMCIRMKTTPI